MLHSHTLYNQSRPNHSRRANERKYQPCSAQHLSHTMCLYGRDAEQSTVDISPHFARLECYVLTCLYNAQHAYRFRFSGQRFFKCIILLRCLQLSFSLLMSTGAPYNVPVLIESNGRVVMNIEQWNELSHCSLSVQNVVLCCH